MFYFRLSSILNTTSSGLFNVPELSSPQGFHIIKEKCKENSSKLVAEACDPNR